MKTYLMKKLDASRRTLLVALLISAILLPFFPVPASAQAESTAPETVTVTLPADESPLFELFSQVKKLIENYHPVDVEDKVLYEGAIKGMMEALDDPYSMYMDEEQMKSFSQSLEGDYTGVGLTLTLARGKVTVVSVFADSPAQRAGIKAGDVITAAGGVSLVGKTHADASQILRGPAGQEVSLTYARPSTGEVFTVTLTRETIKQPSMEGELLTDDIYLLKINQFTRDTGKDFTAVMDFVRLRGTKGLILDLRDNPGGLLDVCVQVASQLVPEGPIVTLKRGELSSTYTNVKQTVPIPIVVLVNGGTASAAEILAGAIRDRGVGVLVGEKTFGKGCVQSVVDLEGDMGCLRLTIADYYTPSGASISGIGLAPDKVVVPQKITLPAKVEYKRPLTPGLVGLDVLAFQQQLAFLGHDLGEPDGVLGASTQKAYAEFLKVMGLPEQTKVDETTIGILYAAVIEKAGKRPDVVLEEGLQILKDKLMTGFWRKF